MPSTGTPELKIDIGASGAPGSSTEDGPPDRMTAFGFIAREGFLRLLIRHDFGIDLFLAHPPRDQLGHLRAEIDDQNFIVGGHGGF